MDVWWLFYLWGYFFSGVGGMGQMQNKRYTLGMTSLPCHSRHEHRKHSRSRVGVLVHMRHDPADGVLVSWKT